MHLSKTLCLELNSGTKNKIVLQDNIRTELNFTATSEKEKKSIKMIHWQLQKL